MSSSAKSKEHGKDHTNQGFFEQIVRYVNE